MKKSIFHSATICCVAAFSSPLSAQIILPEITIVASKYKYLNAVGESEMAQPVRMLEFKAASYDVKQSPYYNDEYDGYYITFYIPDGKILASYDKDGKLLRTAEKFTNTKLPTILREAITRRFPNWSVSRDVYRVLYYDSKNVAEKTYKILLENGDKRMRVKLNEKGDFL